MWRSGTVSEFERSRRVLAVGKILYYANACGRLSHVKDITKL